MHVHRSLWPFQTVMVKEQRYCLTRMGFGLNVAPSIMQAIMETVLFNDVTVQQVRSAYVDGIFLNNCMAPAEWVKQHFLRFGLEIKDLERLGDGARVLGLEVWGECGTLRWKCDSGCPRGCDMSNYFFSMQETDRASASVWVALSGNRKDKAKGQCHDPRMEWHHRRCPTRTNGLGNNSQGDAEGSFAGPMVHNWIRHQCVGRRKFPDDQSAPGTWWCCLWRCVLAATAWMMPSTLTWPNSMRHWKASIWHYNGNAKSCT